jgi:aromatic ring-opening dioxygenase catalytic subunit (LigB family)
LASLRDEGVLLVGSGSSYHNLGAWGSAQSYDSSRQFDDWLLQTLVKEPSALRQQKLTQWQAAPSALACHPRSEHLTPLFVAIGAALDEPGECIYSEVVLNAAISGFRFGVVA